MFKFLSIISVFAVAVNSRHVGLQASSETPLDIAANKLINNRFYGIDAYLHEDYEISCYNNVKAASKLIDRVEKIVSKGATHPVSLEQYRNAECFATAIIITSLLSHKNAQLDSTIRSYIKAKESNAEQYVQKQNENYDQCVKEFNGNEITTSYLCLFEVESFNEATKESSNFHKLDFNNLQSETDPDTPLEISANKLINGQYSGIGDAFQNDYQHTCYNDRKAAYKFIDRVEKIVNSAGNPPISLELYRDLDCTTISRKLIALVAQQTPRLSTNVNSYFKAKESNNEEYVQKQNENYDKCVKEFNGNELVTGFLCLFDVEPSN